MSELDKEKRDLLAEWAAAQQASQSPPPGAPGFMGPVQQPQTQPTYGIVPTALGPMTPQQVAALQGQPVNPAPPRPFDLGTPPQPRSPATAEKDLREDYLNKAAGEVPYQGPPGAAPGGVTALPPPPQVVGMTKAGYVPTARSTTTVGGTEFTPETKQAVSAATEAAGQVDQAQQDLVERQQAHNEKLLNAEVKLARDEQAQDIVRRNVQQQRLNGEWDKMIGLSKDIAEARIDPNRAWNNLSTGGKVGGWVAMIAGGMLAGFRGGPNQGYQAVRDLINDDVEAQKAALAGKTRSLEGAQTMYGMLRQRGLDDETAATAAKIQHHEQLQKELDAADPGLANSRGALAIAQAKMQNQAELAKLRGQFDEKASARVQTTMGESFKAAQPIYAGGSNWRADYDKYAKGRTVEGKSVLSPEAWYAKTHGGGPAEDVKAGAGSPQLADQIAVGNQAIANIDTLRDNTGALPGTGLVGRALHAGAGIPVVGAAAEQAMGTKARQLHGALMSLAEAQAHANGQRGTEAIQMNYKMIVGNGSQDDIDAGIKRAKATLDARGGASTTATGSDVPEGVTVDQ